MELSKEKERGKNFSYIDISSNKYFTISFCEVQSTLSGSLPYSSIRWREVCSVHVSCKQRATEWKSKNTRNVLVKSSIQL